MGMNSICYAGFRAQKTELPQILGQANLQNDTIQHTCLYIISMQLY